MTASSFQKFLLRWYSKNKRDLPWKRTRDPYKILVSEIMLQQTQVSRVLPKYREFLKAFPTVQALAKASDKKLLRVWAGLGYWRRAMFLREAAKQIVKKYRGQFPRDVETLEKLPGIGPYTAAAVACFAFDSPDPFIDTNIRRVYLHFFFPNKKSVSDAEILKIAKRALWKKDPRMWHYALFDYGATVLKDKAINKRSRHYARQSTFTGSFRFFRTQALKLVLATPGNKVPRTYLEQFLRREITKKNKHFIPAEITKSLLADKLVKQSQRYYYL